MRGVDQIKRVAVIGTGTIGFSWTLVFSRAGLATRVYDADPKQLDSLRDRVAIGLAALRRAGRLTVGDLEAASNRVSYCADLASALEDADYVQESVPESLSLKQEVFEELDRRTPRATILGSSASALPMTEIARYTRHPERCIVAHPTNPPHLVPLVEVVPGVKTDPEVTHATYAFMKRLGQEPILCHKEIFGFVLNRLQFALVREAMYLARQGVASIEDIDKCVNQGLGLRWAFLGPFGVEATNAESIEADLRKFSEPMKELMAEVCQPYDGPNEDDIQMVVSGVNEMFAGKRQEELLAYRDAMVLQLREMKERHPL